MLKRRGLFLCPSAIQLVHFKLRGFNNNVWMELIGTASDRHAADAGSIPRCGKVFFSQSQLSGQTLLNVSVHPPCVIACMYTRLRSRSPCQSSVDYGNNRIFNMRRRLSCATLSQLAFLGESNPNFPWEKSHWDNTVQKVNPRDAFATQSLSTIT